MNSKINLYIPGTANRKHRGKISPEGREMLVSGYSEGNSVVELSKMFNVPAGMVSSIVKGRRESPKFKKPTIAPKASGKYSGVLKELHEKRSCLLAKVNKLDDAIRAIKGL